MLNGKQYVGQTSRTLEQRWREHCSSNSQCTYLHNAIVKYGKENFKVEQIDIALDQEELDYKENQYIKSYNTLAPNGYNLDTGGKCGRNLSTTTCYKISENHADVSGKLNPMYGKKRPEVGLKNKITKGRAVNQYTIDGIFIAQYPTIRQAERITGIDNGWISGCCKGKYGYKTAGGFIWEYAD
jgi:group I intron endonuclease